MAGTSPAMTAQVVDMEHHALIPARRETLDHGLARRRQIGKAAANGLDGEKNLAARGAAEKLFRLLGDGLLQFSVIDRDARTILGLVFSERALRLISRRVGNQTQGVGVHPGLVLAASQPSARDLAAPDAVGPAYDPQIRALAQRRTETEGITRIVTRLRPCRGGALQKDKNETAGDLGHLGLHAGSTPASDRRRSGRGGRTPS